MKTVFTDISQVAHLWANKSQNEAKNSGHNFYFEGDTIYSYGRHFPIAKHVVNSNGENAILFTERTYSNTTAKHLHIVRQAASHRNLIYCFNPESTHEQNFTSWLRWAEAEASKLTKAKKPEIYLSNISDITTRVNKYAAFYSIPIPETLQAVLSIGNKNEYAEYSEKKAVYEQAEANRKEKELAKQHKKELAKWLKGESHRLYTRNGYDYLRVNEDRVETTQAVQIPMQTARQIWERIVNNTLSIGEKVMHYEVSEIGKNIVIGCHNFKTDYLLKFGQSVFS